MVFFPSEIESAKGKGEQILLVDTEQRISAMVQSILADSGFQVLVASDGSEALELFRSEIDKISLIVTELPTPLRDGYPLATELWTLNPHVPILFCSRSSSRTDAWNFDKAKHHFALLSKPFTPQELLWHVYQLIHHPESLA